MRLFSTALMAAAVMALAAPVFAQDYQTILDIPAGQTLVNISASESVEVEQDLLIANLRFEAEDKDARALQDKINTVMKKALDAAKSYGEVKTSTDQYHVYPHDYDPNPRPYEQGQPRRERTWRGQQGITLESKNSADLLEVAGKLQEMGLVMGGLTYTLSPELLEATQELLLEGALRKLTAKAERAAKAIGKSKAELLEINLDIGGYYPQPMMRGAAMGAEMAMAKMDAPVADAGQTDITLTVSARAMLK